MISITPKTKVSELLQSYPDLEETLIGLSPAFEKLRNPILRKTIARVATLQQVAVVGNIPLDHLIRTLRKSAGLENYSENMETTQENIEKPAWLKSGSITETIDAREMLERGEHPLGLILGKTQAMTKGEILDLVTPFIPQPLIDKVKAQGLECFTLRVSDHEFHTYFLK